MPLQAEINKEEEWGVSIDGKIDTSCFGQKKSEAGLELGEEVRAEDRSESTEQTTVELLEDKDNEVSSVQD